MYAAIFKVAFFGAIIVIAKKLLKCLFSKSENPFKIDSRRTPEPLVLDKKKRKAVIKQKFSVDSVPKNLDAIVIGSGIGGLSAAALLSKAGKKVLVLEQLNKAGGCTHTFKEKGIEFDVGIHYIGDMMDQTLSKTFVDQITYGQLQWAPLEDAFDVVLIGNGSDQKRYEISSGHKKVSDLKKYFPDETKAIDEFFSIVKSVNKDFLFALGIIRMFPRAISRIFIKLGLFNWMKWFKLSKVSLYDYMKNLTKNEDLRAVLSYCFGDYGTLPKDTCIGFHAFLWKHFYHRVAYPVGGASEFAFHIIPVIEESGGKVLTNANATNIILRNGRAVGVTIQSGKSEYKIYAPTIISNAGIHNTFKKFLPQDVVENLAINSLIKQIKHAISGFSVFVGLDGSNEDLGLKAQNIWAFSNNQLDESARKFFLKSSEEAENSDVPLMFQSFPSAKDPSWDQRFPGKSSMTIVSLANYDWFQQWKDEPVKKRNDEYNVIKNRIGETLVEQSLKIFPHLKEKINDVCVGSPLTNDHYIGSPKGEIYGLDHTAYRFGAEALSELRPDTEIPGLFITGQDTLSCGFGGALFGGLLCASSVLDRILIKDLLNLHSKMKKKIKKSN